MQLYYGILIPLSYRNPLIRVSMTRQLRQRSRDALWRCCAVTAFTKQALLEGEVKLNLVNA